MADFLKKLFNRQQEDTVTNTPDRQEAELYVHSVEHQRQQKDAYFKRGGGSPIPPGERLRFAGLKYFPPDKAYRLRVKLDRSAEPERIVMPVSQGAERSMLEWGIFNFELNGAHIALAAYKPGDVPPDELDEAGLFIPFRDATSGKETYGAGRYLDLEDEPEEGGYYMLDFNLAYNPYCAYNEEYSCPLPPIKNWLKVPVRAGEKTYKEISYGSDSDRHDSHDSDSDSDGGSDGGSD